MEKKNEKINPENNADKILKNLKFQNPNLVIQNPNYYSKQKKFFSPTFVGNSSIKFPNNRGSYKNLIQDNYETKKFYNNQVQKKYSYQKWNANSNLHKIGGRNNSEKKKNVVINNVFLQEENDSNRYEGRLKFFDEAKNYGFIVLDEDKTDIFVHYDDLCKANIDKEFLKTAKKGNNIRFSFNLMNYMGKYDKSRKAIDIELIAITEKSDFYK